VTARLVKNQPLTTAPSQTSNDGKLAAKKCCSSGVSREIDARNQSTFGGENPLVNRQREPREERAALRNEGLRFHEGRKSAPLAERPDPEFRSPTTSERWRLLRSIAMILKPREQEQDGKAQKRGPSVCGCGFGAVVNETVNVHLRQTGSRYRASVSGVYRCDSPWLCPNCSVRMAVKRQAKVQKVVEATLAKGGLFPHVVLTVRHANNQDLASLKAAVQTASRIARQGRKWQQIKGSMQAVGVLSAPEATWSPRNGWHFHVHLAIPSLSSDVDSILAGCASLVERYLVELKKLGFDATWKGQYVHIGDSAEKAAAYVAKGISWEISGGASTKTSTRVKGSLTPFAIASLAAEGNAKMRDLWVEYARAMIGTRSCVVTPAISEALDIPLEDAISMEQELPEPDDVVGTIPTCDWNILLRRGYTPTFFDRLETETAVAWPEIRAWALAACKPYRLSADDIESDDTPAPVPLFDPTPRPNPATEIALQARKYYGATKLIADSLARLGRDYAKHRGPAPPSLVDIEIALKHLGNQNVPANCQPLTLPHAFLPLHVRDELCGPLREPELNQTLGAFETSEAMVSQPCFAGPAAPQTSRASLATREIAS
jgi:hypothetical protein